MWKLSGVLLVSALSLCSINIAFAKTCIMNNTDKVLVLMSDARGHACHSYATITANTRIQPCFNDCGSDISIHNPSAPTATLRFVCSVSPGSSIVVTGYHNNYHCSPGTF